MGLFNKGLCTLHIAFLLGKNKCEWSRWFVAIDIKKRDFYYIVECLDNHFQPIYEKIEQIDETRAEELFLKVKDNKDVVFIPDWNTFDPSLCSTEIIEIPNERIACAKKAYQKK